MRFERRSIFAITTGIFMLTANVFGQQQYHSNDLTPPQATAAKLMGASQGKQVGGGNNNHAYVIHGNALSATDLHPAAGYYTSMATASDDIEECGYGSPSLGGIHALKWSGSAGSVVDLQPSGYNFSYCVAVDNGQQAGFAENQVYFLTTSHAMLWSGTPTPVDLHPVSAFPYSRAMGLKGGEQVGYVSTIAYPYGDPGYHATSHAYRWTGTAASGTDLHPLQFDASEALATNGLQEGGWGYSALDTVSHVHALLWSGNAQNYLDLSPAGFTDTKVTAMSATQQVGEGWVGTVRHALLWTGTADSVVDLNQFLPAGYTHAVATGIDGNGNAVGYAYNTYYVGLSISPDAIAVVFAPGQASPASVSSITLAPASAAPGDVVSGVVKLGGAAPAGGVNLSFLSTDLNMAATPSPITIAEGQSSAAFSLPVLGLALTAPSTAKIFVTDGAVSKVAALSVVPIVRLSSVSANAVEGGFATYGTAALSIPAQSGGAVITMTSGNPALVTVPASVTVPYLASLASFSMTTSAVTTLTSVPITATFNGTSVTTQVALNAAPVVSLSAISMPAVVGGQSFTGTVTLNNFPRQAAGATVTLSSGDPSVQVPASVVIPQGAFTASFTGTTGVVLGLKNVTVKASYNGSNITGSIAVNPTPLVTIISAEYFVDTQLFKVQANTSFANSVLTYGTDPNGPALGTMQIELGVWKGSMLMATAPTQATVWNSNGGKATMAVTVKTSVAGGGGATGGGGGGGGATSTVKLTVVSTGKGSVTSAPSGIGCGAGGSCSGTFTSGTAVTLTATPAAGSPWIGWSGACSGNSTTCTLTLTANTSVTANFK